MSGIFSSFFLPHDISLFFLFSCDCEAAWTCANKLVTEYCNSSEFIAFSVFSNVEKLCESRRRWRSDVPHKLMTTNSRVKLNLVISSNDFLSLISKWRGSRVRKTCRSQRIGYFIFFITFRHNCMDIEQAMLFLFIVHILIVNLFKEDFLETVSYNPLYLIECEWNNYT